MNVTNNSQVPDVHTLLPNEGMKNLGPKTLEQEKKEIMAVRAGVITGMVLAIGIVSFCGLSCVCFAMGEELMGTALLVVMPLGLIMPLPFVPLLIMDKKEKHDVEDPAKRLKLAKSLLKGDLKKIS